MKVNKLASVAFALTLAINGYTASTQNASAAAATVGNYRSLLDAMRGDEIKNYRGHMGGELFVLLKDRKVPLTSDYASEDPIKQAQFAIALANFISQNGGGWDNFKAHQSAGPQDPESVLLGRSGDGDAWEKTAVPFVSQKNFAKTWWSANSDHFNSSSRKDVFLKEAVLDANNIYLSYEMMTGPKSAYVDHQLWNNVVLSDLSKAK
jgi:hypothetical protein